MGERRCWGCSGAPRGAGPGEGVSTGPGPRRAPDKALAHRGHGERIADMGLSGLVRARLSRCPALALLAGPGRRAGGRETRGRLSRAVAAGAG